MAFTVSVTAITTSRHVLGTVSDCPGGTAYIDIEAQYRKFASWGRSYDVLEWTAQPTVVTDSSFYDYPPFNFITRYVVTARSSTGSSLGLATSSEVTLYGDTVHVMSVSAATGWDAQVTSDQPSSWQARSSWHTVIGRRRPVAQVAHMLEQDGSISVRLAGRSDFATLRAAVDEGWPLRIRSGCERVWTNGVVLPLSVTWSPAIEGSVARLATIDYQTVLEYAVVRTPTDTAES